MKRKQVTAAQLKAECGSDIDMFFEKLAQALNNAEDDHIIDKSEEPARDASAELRKKAYEKGVGLVKQPESTRYFFV